MILISPYARTLRNGSSDHPKKYPHWDRLIPMLKEIDDVVQVGSGDETALPGITDLRLNLLFTDLEKLVKECRTWISVDSFFQHYCWDLGKPGIVLWGQSDPLIFGHPENTNLLKSRIYLRDKQFWQWEQTHYNPNAFVQPSEVIAAITR